MEQDNENTRFDCFRGCTITVDEDTGERDIRYRPGCCKLEVYDVLKGISQEQWNDYFEVRFKNTRKGISTEYKLYVFGKLAREKLIRNGFNVDTEFSFPISEPTFFRARNVSSIIKQKFLQNEFDLVYLIYTKMESMSKMVPVAVRLAPVDLKSLKEIMPRDVDDAGLAMEKGGKMEYDPNANEVFGFLIDTYLNAIIYGAMVDAYASEQTARLTAMDNATNNADEMMKKLMLISNRARQAKITNELTEIINGAQQADNL